MTRHGLADLTSPEFAARADRTKVALIPVGATEQHGANLGMGIDWRVAAALAERVAARVDPFAVVVPALPVGLSGHHMSFPGTLSVSAATFTALCTDIASSLARHGIRKIVFVNGHRGNESVLGVITTTLTYDAGIEAASAFWMTQASDVIADYVTSRRWGHACEIETSLAMALCPDLVRDAALEPHGYTPIFLGATLLYAGVAVWAWVFPETRGVGIAAIDESAPVAAQTAGR
ncbi:MAG: creatininase family protein [Streptosporangiales bacterium]|nr:creatininase family protein [Streptosporangiales bacterium]